MEEEVKDQLYYISTIPRTVQWFIYNGYSEIQAQEKAMEIYDAPLGTVLFHWKRYCKAQEKKKRENRNELIMTLMRAGLSNKEIGDKVGMHANSISRIITKTRVEYHSKK